MVGILDWFGRLIKKPTLEESQTSRVASLHQQYATHPSRGLTPARLASILEAAEQGDLIAQCDLFEDMEEKDGHIFSEMSKRKRALLGLAWDIVPPRDASKQEEAAAALAKELIQDIADFDDVLLDALDAVGKGYACLEIEWSRTGKYWLPKAITHRPPSWFTVDRETRTQLRLRSLGAEGEPLQPFGWIVHAHKAKSGYVTRAGLHRILAWPFLFKNYSVRDLAEFLEIYGLPLRLGKYPPGASPEEKATLLRAVVNIGHAAAGIIPQGMEIDFQEAAKGASDPYMAMVDWCERTQSKAIIGQVLSSEAKATGMGSGVANLHGEVRRDLLVSDAAQLGGTLTRDLVYPLIALNTAALEGPHRCPRFEFDTREPEELNTFSLGISRLVSIGVQIPEPWVHEKTGIPMPKEGELTLQRQGIGPDPAAEAMRARLRNVAALKAAPGDAGTTDLQVDQLEQAGAPALDAMIDTIRRLVDEVQTLEELRDRLLEAFPDMPADDLAAVMAEALTTAQLAGRYEILEGL